jgi:hypothetical protein
MMNQSLITDQLTTTEQRDNGESLLSLTPHLQSLLREMIDDGIKKGIENYIEVQKLINHDTSSEKILLGTEVVIQSPTSSDSTLSSTPISSQSSATDTDDSLSSCPAVILKVNETLRKNKRKILLWENKTLQNVHPVINDEKRLLLAIVESGADFLADVRLCSCFLSFVVYLYSQIQSHSKKQCGGHVL